MTVETKCPPKRSEFGPPMAAPDDVFRVIDWVTATVLLALSAPALLLIAALVALDGGPILVAVSKQPVGSGPTGDWKFRTAGHRFGRMSRFLERCALDEIPRLVGVVQGRSSLSDLTDH